MAGGRPPKPIRMHKLNGTYRKDRHGGKGGPGLAGQAPRCPAWLSEEAKGEWKRVAGVLAKLGLLASIDQAALAAYCQAFAEMVKATRMLEQDGLLLEQPVFNRKGEKVGDVKKPHPAVAMQRSAFVAVKRFLSEFGLTPASRARLPIDDQVPAYDPMEAWLNAKLRDN